MNARWGLQSIPSESGKNSEKERNFRERLGVPSDSLSGVAGRLGERQTVKATLVTSAM